MKEQKEIPEEFESWIQFYDHMNKTIPFDNLTDILRFFKQTKHFPSSTERWIKIETLKAKCFDEIIAKRIPKQIGKQICAEILVTYRNVHFNPEYYKKIEEMITAMSLPE